VIGTRVLLGDRKDHGRNCEVRMVTILPVGTLVKNHSGEVGILMASWNGMTTAVSVLTNHGTVWWSVYDVVVLK
jgi:hypothetical protein